MFLLLTYNWKKRIPGPVEATSSTLEVAHDDNVWKNQQVNWSNWFEYTVK